jgi:hypothetical protein
LDLVEVVPPIDSDVLGDSKHGLCEMFLAVPLAGCLEDAVGVTDTADVHGLMNGGSILSRVIPPPPSEVETGDAYDDGETADDE